MPAEIPPGVREILKIIKTFEDIEISCCLVGTSALRYYGARRMSDEWQVCVPTDRWNDATEVVTTNPKYDKQMITTDQKISDLFQTYPRYVLAQNEEPQLDDFAVVILPARAAHLEGQCQPVNIERSQTGLPYPKLDILVQSVLDVNRNVDLADVVDGMDLSESWGRENLNLEGETDLEWGQWANDRLIAVLGESDPYLLPTGGVSRLKIWTRVLDEMDSLDVKLAEEPATICLRFTPRYIHNLCREANIKQTTNIDLCTGSHINALEQLISSDDRSDRTGDEIRSIHGESTVVNDQMQIRIVQPAQTRKRLRYSY